MSSLPDDQTPAHGSSAGQTQPAAAIHQILDRGVDRAVGALRWQIPLALLVLALALLWRLAGLRELEVWRDEALTLIDARLGWHELLVRLPFVEDTPPLPFAAFKVWLTLLPTELGARLLPVLAGVATVGILMWMAFRIAPRRWWAAGALAAFSYETLVYSQEIRVYSLLLFFTALTLLASEKI